MYTVLLYGARCTAYGVYTAYVEVEFLSGRFKSTFRLDAFRYEIARSRTYGCIYSYMYNRYDRVPSCIRILRYCKLKSIVLFYY